MKTIREPVIAGDYYPADPNMLHHNLEVLLHNTATQPAPLPKVLIVPHAGYYYSGPIAAEAFRLLNPERHVIHRIVIFGPSHRIPIKGMALPTSDAFATPLGQVPVNRDLVKEIGQLPGVTFSDSAHLIEHSIEAQLPFLQEILDSFEIVPVLVGDAEPQHVAAVIDALWGGPETVLVISTDLSHYHDYAKGKALDAQTADKILRKDYHLTRSEACGARAINGLMLSKHADTLRARTIVLRNSADTAGQKGEIVGYGAFMLY